MKNGTTFKYYYCKIVDAIGSNWSLYNQPREKNTKVLLKLLEWFSWNLVNQEEFPNIINKIDDQFKTIEMLNKIIHAYHEENENLKTHISSLKIIHEAEIIRLKDIIQAKQVQLDKLLENDNENN